MTKLMMMLGPFMFSINTASFQELTRTDTFRWETNKCLKSDDKLQYTGRDLPTIRLSGTIYPEYKGGPNQIDQLRELAKLAKSQLLVDGMGRIYGLWVIKTINETKQDFTRYSTPKKITFNIELIRHKGNLLDTGYTVINLIKNAKKIVSLWD